MMQHSIGQQSSIPPSTSEAAAGVGQSYSPLRRFGKGPAARSKESLSKSSGRNRSPSLGAQNLDTRDSQRDSKGPIKGILTNNYTRNA